MVDFRAQFARKPCIGKRCLQHGKHCYGTREAAERAARKHRQHAYLAGCGWYHLTSKGPDLMDEAKAAIDAVFSDTSVSVEDTFERMMELMQHIGESVRSMDNASCRIMATSPDGNEFIDG